MPDWSKIGKSSKRKGKSYENKCAKLLTEFTGVNFRKTAGSGGWNKQGVTVREELFAGDLISDNPGFKFCVEAKNRPNDFEFDMLLRNPSGNFSDWWYQCVQDAKSVEKLPILFFKPRIRVDLVAVTKEGLEALNYPSTAPRIAVDIFRKPVQVKDYITRGEKVTVKLPVAYIVEWKQLISLIKPEGFFDEEE